MQMYRVVPITKRGNTCYLVLYRLLNSQEMTQVNNKVARLYRTIYNRSMCAVNNNVSLRS